MAHHSLNDLLSNQKSLSHDVNIVALRDKLHEELRQAKALIVLANGQNFLNNDKVIVHLTFRTTKITI